MTEPQTPQFTVNDPLSRRLRELTPDHNQHVPDNSSKENCEFLIFQGWGGKDSEVLEQKRRETIKSQRYWGVGILKQLDMIAERVSVAELPQLHRTTDGLNGLLLDLGMAPEDIENVRIGIPETATEFWDEEERFLASLREETERLGHRWDDSRSAPSSHTSASPLTQRSINRPSLPSHPMRGPKGSSGRSPRGAYNAGVQKRPQKTHNRSITMVSEQRDHSPLGCERLPTIVTLQESIPTENQSTIELTTQNNASSKITSNERCPTPDDSIQDVVSATQDTPDAERCPTQDDTIRDNESTICTTYHLHCSDNHHEHQISTMVDANEDQASIMVDASEDQIYVQKLDNLHYGVVSNISCRIESPNLLWEQRRSSTKDARIYQCNDDALMNFTEPLRVLYFNAIILKIDSTRAKIILPRAGDLIPLSPCLGCSIYDDKREKSHQLEMGEKLHLSRKQLGLRINTSCVIYLLWLFKNEWDYIEKKD
ncbi:hypothetical protein V8C35DRAFT_318668 [Trichoderma chlorosporum]